MPKLKPGTVIPDQEEDAAINAGIADDADNPEWTKEAFANARPAREVLPAAFFEARERRGRGPGKRPAKILVSVRLSREVVSRLEAEGPGWRTRVDDILKKAVGL